MKLSALTLAILLLCTSCKRDEEQQRPEFLSAFNEMNVAYGSDSRQKIDYYLPANRVADSTPSIILIHGGAWMDGDKADFNGYVSMLQQQLPGYAIFNINYRLAANGRNLFPTQENDVKAALSFIHDHRKEYGIGERFVLLGASAGAHLALLQAYKYDEPVKPVAVISLFGPTELKSLYQTDPLASLLLGQLLGTTPTANADVYDQSSPDFFASAAAPPTLFLHGGKDPLVPPSQSENLHQKLKSAGVTTEYVFYPNEAHGWTGQSLNDTFNKIIAFIRQEG